MFSSLKMPVSSAKKQKSNRVKAHSLRSLLCKQCGKVCQNQNGKLCPGRAVKHREKESREGNKDSQDGNNPPAFSRSFLKQDQK